MVTRLHTSRFIPIGAALFASILFAANAISVNLLVSEGMGVLTVNAIRILGGAAALGIAATVRRRGLPSPQGQQISRGLLIAQGLVGFFGVPVMYTYTVTRLPVAQAVFIEFTAPIYVALAWKYLFSQQVGRKAWCALAIGMLGMIALTRPGFAGSPLDLLGLAAAFASAMLLAAFYLMARVASVQSDSWTAQAFAVGAIPSVSVAIAAGLSGDGGLGPTAISPRVGLLATYCVLLGTALPYWLLSFSLRSLTPTRVSAVGLAEPVAATILAAAILGQDFASIQVVGAALVLVAVGVSIISTASGSTTPRVAPEDGPAAS